MSKMISLDLITHRVAIRGQVVIAYTVKVNDKEVENLSTPVSQALVEISEYPEGLFKRKLSLLKSLSDSQKWESLSNRPDRTLTAGDGSFFFMDLPSGNYILRAFYPFYKFYLQTDEVTVAVVENQKSNWIKLILKVSGVSGQVTTGDKFSPVAYAKVRFQDSDEYTLCDRDGKFLLLYPKPPPSSPVQLTIFAPGYSNSIVENITLSSGIVESIPSSKTSLTKANGVQI